ncbi:enoyl-CoA hydratase/isomerase family protein [Janibacter sp. G1551]|uniref:enoyl-CoA hydratase/isomerase family protein n=1 Tax=Janibacter sp. G1551 TaxID=3420440 RepID=UPI003D05533F
MTVESAATPAVQFAIADGVATVTINKPETMNALDLAVKEGLLASLRQVADDAAVRCVVLTGAGERAFCAGQDLKEHAALLEKEGFTLSSTVTEHYNPIVELLATMNKPVIAALNGVAAGAGASFALAADLRIAADTASINFAFAGIGLSCDSGASWALPRLVGPSRAKELLLLPRTIRSAEALSLGLVTEVVPAADLASRVAEVAGTLAQGPTLAYGSIRRAVAHSSGHDLSDSLAHEAELMALTGASGDHRAAVASFLAKERPTFNGR